MRSLLLMTATRLLLPLLLLFSLLLLFRGHDESGGGFIGGLVAVAAFALHGLAFGLVETRKILRISPQGLLALGLGIAVVAGLIGLMEGGSFLTALWSHLKLAALGRFGTPLLFDMGVYFTVIGSMLLIFFSLMEA